MKKQFYAFILLSFLNFSCSQSLMTASAPTSNNLGDNQPNENPTENPTPQPIPRNFPDVTLKGHIVGGNYSSFQSIQLDKKTESLILTIPLSSNSYLEKLNKELTTHKGVKIAIIQDNYGVYYLSVQIPLTYIMRGASINNKQKLPNGDPLPGVPEGQLPTIEIPLIKKNKVILHIYIDKNIAAFFIESPFNPYVSALYKIKDEFELNTVGYFAIVPEKNKFQGGFFVSVKLPPSISKALDDYFNSP